MLIFVLTNLEKTLQNYKSGLFRYSEYLSEQSDEEPKVEKREIEEFKVQDLSGNTIQTNDEPIVFTKKDLLFNFKSRLKTQDRTYDAIYFSIRFITRSFRVQNKQEIYNKWLDNLINSIVIYTNDGVESLKNVELLTILGDEVSIETKNGVKKIVFTKLVDNTNLEPLCTKEIKNVVIDHETSLFNVMNENYDKLPTFINLTGEFKKNI